MQFELNGDGFMSIKKFELMLKSNAVGFFDSEEFEQIVEHYLESGKMNMARKAAHLGLSQHPSSVTIKLLQAEILVFDNEFDKAHEILNQLYELQPHNSEIYIQKANIFSKTDEHEKAVELLKKALELTEDQADVYNLIGMEYLFIEDYKQAKENFISCLELDDTDYSALYNIIYCFDFLKEHKGAIDFLNQFLNNNPYSEVAWHQVGKQNFDLKMYDKALSAFDFAIISDELFVGAYLEKGKVLEKLGKYNEAIENYQITLKLDDPTSFAYLRLGKCYEKLGAHELAIKFFKKTVKEDPLLDKGWIALVDYYSTQLNYQKALSYIEKATEIDEENALYWIRYAKLNKKLNFFEESEHGYRRAIELGNYELDTWLERSDILLQLGEIEAVVSNLEHGLEFYPEDAEIEYRLAGAYFKTNDLIKARFHLQNAFKNDPECIVLLENLYPQVWKSNEVQSIIK
ncbi:tetratricopeptide repeat protein [Nonlabens sp.]|uniref:tetratricopeptide repeat protein n=1 Tax=Nonlabens sp. TaxID=1888209 RepID=UPI003F6959EC